MITKKDVVQVLPTEDGKRFRVMINFIQHGAEYQSEANAIAQAEKVKNQNLIVH